jgi:hypothetical protein
MRNIGRDGHSRQPKWAIGGARTGEVVNLTLLHEGNRVREHGSLRPPVLVAREVLVGGFLLQVCCG